MTYSLKRDGTIHVSTELSLATDRDLPDLPRLGMQLSMPGAFSKMSWYGRGPHETYADRKTSAPVSLYQRDVRQQEHHYIRPQENSNRTDVRWIALTDEHGAGLLAVGDDLLNVSAWPYLQSDIDFRAGDGSESASGLVPVTTKHAIDVPVRDLVTVNIDHLQMGVGGDTSWGRPVHQQYRIPPGNYHYGFTLVPILPNHDVSALARTIKRHQ
jgi:beta-galactosidase